MPLTGTCACSTHKRQEGFLEFPPSTFPSTVCLALGYNTTVSLLTTVHASESCIITSCGFWISFLNHGWCFLSKISQVAFPRGFSAPWFNNTVPGGVLGNQTWVIRPRSSLLLHSSKRVSCCDDATKSKFGSKHILKERLPKSNLACRGVKKFNPIIPSSDVGNLQTKNE